MWEGPLSDPGPQLPTFWPCSHLGAFAGPRSIIAEVANSYGKCCGFADVPNRTKPLLGSSTNGNSDGGASKESPP